MGLDNGIYILHNGCCDEEICYWLGEEDEKEVEGNNDDSD